MARGEEVRSILRVTFGLITLTSVAVQAPAQEAASGPEIVFMGVIRADDTLVEQSGVDVDGRSIFDRPLGFGFSLVVEVDRGASGRPVGSYAFTDSGCPDLQVQVSRPLGDGSEIICDTVPPDDGGVPAIDPPELDGEPSLCDPVNDLGCRFVDGRGEPLGRECRARFSEGCVLFPSGESGCVSSMAEAQFCGRIARSAEFPTGETLVTARVRDTEGNLGPPAQIIVRIATSTPTPTATPTPTFTPLPTATRRPYDNDDGCAILPPDRMGIGWTLLLLPGLLLALRCRRRTA